MTNFYHFNRDCFGHCHCDMEEAPRNLSEYVDLDAYKALEAENAMLRARLAAAEEARSNAGWELENARQSGREDSGRDGWMDGL